MPKPQLTRILLNPQLVERKLREIDEELLSKPWLRDDETPLIPRPWVLVNGCFDILHAGHFKIFQLARSLARNGSVILAIDSDEMVQKAKGPTRPCLTREERIASLIRLPWIDALYETESDERFIKWANSMQFDLRVQGSDHTKGTTASRLPTVPVASVNLVGEVSTTEVENRFLQRDRMLKRLARTSPVKHIRESS